ncbi:MAG: ABC transporter permease [Candidatus Obscuribacterales bacterium]|nr:ABC transporter permease [Candidatus Obscuribacterales bacterium]
MHAILAIIHKDILQWTRRPLYFISSVSLAVLIISMVGNTISGAGAMPFGLYDPTELSNLQKTLNNSKKFNVIIYDDLSLAKQDLVKGKIVALANVSQDLLEDSVQIITEGHNPLVNDQISMGLIGALTESSSDLSLPLASTTIFPVQFTLRDFVTPGLAAYLCYVLASMNLGFSWIYEWMEKTYRQIVLAPYGLRSAIIAKTLTVTIEASVVLWLALLVTAPTVGFTLGSNFAGLVGITLLSMFCFTCIGLGAACLLKTIRIYTMTVSIAGVALMFASGVVMPVEGMPLWEQWLAKSFPMYYAADAFKGVMLDTPAAYGNDCLILSLWAIAGLSFASLMLYRRQATL